MRTGIVKRFNNEEANNAGGRNAQTGFPPQQRIARHETEMLKMPAEKSQLRMNNMAIKLRIVSFVAKLELELKHAGFAKNNGANDARASYVQMEMKNKIR